jgi:hypothetical protein
MSEKMNRSLLRLVIFATLLFPTVVFACEAPLLTNSPKPLSLTLGVGGSLLAIGSAPSVGLLGQIKQYTFSFHMRWMPIILVGYFASIAVHF